MEKLIALALLYFAGFDVWDDFSAQTDKLFLSEPDNEDLGYIEFASDKKDAVIHAVSLINKTNTVTGDLMIDTNAFGEALMAALETEFKKNEISLAAFSERTMEIYRCFPWEIKYKEPFISLDYAGDSLGYGDEEHCREIFQNAFVFYKNNCLLKINITHRAFEKYDIYIDSKKKNITNRKSYSELLINIACDEETEILIRKRNILEKWYWFISLFNIFNFFYAFSFYGSFPAFYDSGNISYKIKIKPEEKIKEIFLDLEIDNKEYGDRNFYQAVKQIKTSGISQLTCYRIPSSVRYKNRWRSSKICSLVLYIAASYVFIMAKMIFGDVKIDAGLIVYAVVSFSICVYYVVTVLKAKSISDVIKNNEITWEKKSI